ncbi:hypothetical protein BJX61DRAFT_492066 [Aspergillus egyptiacus]|nr:hypothetical protein BJX61DRAFT_492066 [Aspergillus egyptiacus]
MLNIDCVPEAFIERFPEGASIHGILAAYLSKGDASSLERWKPWRDTWPDPQSFKDCMPIAWIGALESATSSLEHKPGGKYHLLPPAASGSWNTSSLPEGSTRDDAPGGTYQDILPKQEERISAAWETVREVFPDTNWDTFCYHWFIVNTRSFYYVSPGEEEPEDWNDAVGLVPIADYFNHADDPACMATFHEDGYTLSATRRIEKGEEVHISYGSHTNDYLFIEYGFFLDHNPSDAIFLDDLIFRELTESELETLRYHDLYGDYKLTHHGACPRTQAVACIRYMSSRKWEDYVLHHSLNNTDREIMTDIINGWVRAYLKECDSTIQTLSTMRREVSSVPATNGEGASVPVKLSTLLKRWEQIRCLCEATLHGSSRHTGSTTA